MTTATLASNFGLISFSLASIFYLQAQSSSQLRLRLQSLAFFIFLAGTISCTVGLLSHVNGEYIMASSGLLLTVSLSVLCVVAHLFFKMPTVGLFFSPLCTLVLLIDSFSQPAQPISQASENSFATFWLQTHIAVSLVGEAFAIGCCVVAILYLMQQRALKQKRLESMAAGTPTLDRLDRLLFWGLWLGFLGITTGLVTGAIYSQLYVPHATGRLELKILWAIAVWIWYLATLLARNVFGRSVRDIARLCLGGFLLLFGTFFGLAFFHPFGGV